MNYRLIALFRDVLTHSRESVEETGNVSHDTSLIGVGCIAEILDF